MQIEIRSGTSARISGYVNAVARDSRRLPSCMCPGAKRDFIERVEPDAFRRAIEKKRQYRDPFQSRTIAWKYGGRKPYA